MHRRIRDTFVRKSANAAFVLRQTRPEDRDWVIQQHRTIYGQEYACDPAFQALVESVVNGFFRSHDAGRERGWIAELVGKPVGCVFVMQDAESRDTAKLRLLLIDPGSRGLGLGNRLVHECTLFARSAGYRRIILWTYNILIAARCLYDKEGYRLTREEPDYSLGRNLVSETWELIL
jgi:GNAT superfamily N-acetyltransferase